MSHTRRRNLPELWNIETTAEIATDYTSSLPDVDSEQTIELLPGLRFLEARDEDFLDARIFTSQLLINGSIEVDPDIRGGIPVLRHTRISVSQMFAELSDAQCVFEFADEYDIDAKVIQDLFEGMSIQLDRPFLK